MKYSDFVEAENKTYDSSLKVIGDRIGYLYTLSELFRIPIDKTKSHLDSHPSVFVLWWLANLTLNSLFNSFQNYFRLHSDICLSSIRYGIEASLKALVVQFQEDIANDFITKDLDFKTTVRVLKNKYKLNAEQKDIVSFLVRSWGDCSSFGSHAGLDSITHRRFHQPDATNDRLVHYNFFQVPKSETYFKREYFAFLVIYIRCLQIYKPFFFENSSFMLSEWDSKADELIKNLNQDIAMADKVLRDEIQNEK